MRRERPAIVWRVVTSAASMGVSGIFSKPFPLVWGSDCAFCSIGRTGRRRIQYLKMGRVLGLHDVPHWLVVRQADKYAIVITIVLALAYATTVWSIAPWLLRKRGRASEKQYAIGVTCTWSRPPTHYRDHKTLFTVHFQGIPTKGLDPNRQLAGPRSFIRGSTHSLIRRGFPKTWWRCDVTNYSGVLLRNVRIKFPVQFNEIVRWSSGEASGDIIALGYALSPGLELGTGSDDRDYFYFINESRAFVTMGYPLVAEAEVIGDVRPRVLKVLPSSHDPDNFCLFPEATNPPAEPPPSLAPPDMPERK